MLRLEKRRNVSRAWAVTTPLIAVLLTMLFGGIMFGLLLDEFASAFSAIKLIFLGSLV
jgi:simple sugar transport system permease protein